MSKYVIQFPNGMFFTLKRLTGGAIDEAMQFDSKRAAEMYPTLRPWLTWIADAGGKAVEIESSVRVGPGETGIRTSEITAPTQINKVTVTGRGAIGIDMDD